MNQQTTIDPISKELELPCDPTRAFDMFTKELSSWWPLATHSLGGEGTRECHMDDYVGGQIYEMGGDQVRQAWGTIKAWQPPHRLVFTFHHGREEATAGTVEVSFTAAGSGCRVELEHRGWELLGESGATMRDNYDSGWGEVFGRCFFEYAVEAS